MRRLITCGVVHRAADGQPDGLLSEGATNPVLGRSPNMEIERLDAEMLDLVERNCRLHLAAGVTAVQDAWVSPRFLEAFTRAAQVGTLPIYLAPLRGNAEGLFGTPAPWLEPGAIETTRPAHLRMGGIKLFAGGVWEGVLYYSQNELNPLVTEGSRRGLTVAIHVSWEADDACADGTEDVEGSITPGKLANFVVLAQDPRMLPPVNIRDIQVDETWVDGQRAYCRASISATTRTERTNHAEH